MEMKEEIAKMHELVKEAESLLEKGDAEKAAEKLSEAANIAIILLAEKYQIEEAKIAKQNGKWNYDLIFHSVFKLSRKLGDIVLDGWTSADYLVNFNYDDPNEKLSVDSVRFRLPEIKKFIKFAENEILSEERR